MYTLLNVNLQLIKGTEEVTVGGSFHLQRHLAVRSKVKSMSQTPFDIWSSNPAKMKRMGS